MSSRVQGPARLRAGRSPDVSEAEPDGASNPDVRFEVMIEPQGWKFEAPNSMPLLEAARRAGFTLPNSCRNGTCRACICRLASGRVRYAIAWPGLSAEEKKEGYILPCVAYPDSALVIDAPEASEIAALR